MARTLVCWHMPKCAYVMWHTCVHDELDLVVILFIVLNQFHAKICIIPHFI